MSDSQRDAAYPAAHAGTPLGAQEDEIDLARLWALLWGGRWTVVAAVAIAIVCAAFYLFVVQPTYKADALIQIQSDSNSPLQGVTADIQQLTGKSSSPAQTQIPIIKSRSVLGDTVNKLHLTTEAKPAYFPLVGQSIVGYRKKEAPASKAVNPDDGNWLSHYAWSPDDFSVTRLDVPSSLQGQPFTLRALGDGKYLLYGPEGGKILRGQAGKPANGVTSQGGHVGIFVSKLAVSSPPTDFTLGRHGWLPVVQSLQAKLGVSEQGDDTGIVRISLEGHDRGRITSIVNSVAENYLRQNVEARSEQAKKSLDFLDTQLPKLKSDLQSAEAKLAQFQEKSNTVDLGAEGQALLQRAVSLEEKRSQLKLKLSELRQTYTSKHPSVEAARDQLNQLTQQRKQLEKQIGKLPDAQKQMFALQRDVQVKTQLYTGMLNRAQELRVVKAGTVGNVRIIDKAVQPVKAVSPDSKLALLLAIVLGGGLGCGLILLRAVMRRNVDDPKEIENRLGLSVYAVVPFCDWLAKESRRAKRQRQPAPLLARDHQDEVSVEALRSLRTSLYFAQMEAGSNVILMTGLAPGVGKSFVSVNLAHLLTEAGQRVVVIDADMRRGRLHEFFADRKRGQGLSELLTGQIPLYDALRTLEGSHVQIMTTGAVPPNPSELLMRESFPMLLNELKEQYDLVIVDAPPILAVTDAAVVSATIPGIVTFMVAGAGMHPLPELEESVKRMSRNDHKVAGVVFNAYRRTHADYSGGYSYYQYEYKS